MTTISYTDSTRYAGKFVLCFLVGLLWALPAQAVVTKADIKDVSGELVCYCGCASKVVSTCGCGTADMIEADIGKQLEAGKTKEEIIAAYVATHGVEGLATPPAEGFNLTAWIIPIMAICLGGFVIRTAVVRWRQRGREVEEAHNQNETKPEVKAVKHQDKILRELEDME